MEQKILYVLNRNNLTCCTSVIAQLEAVVMKISMKKSKKVHWTRKVNWERGNVVDGIVGPRGPLWAWRCPTEGLNIIW
jgi:hypothetical protein